MGYDWTGGATLSPYQQKAPITFPTSGTSGGGGGGGFFGGLGKLIEGPAGIVAGPVIGALASLFAPNKAEQEKKAQLELMAKQNQYGIEGEERKLDRIKKYSLPERKKTDISKNLPQLNDFFTRLVMGLNKENFGGDRSKDWGIDWNALFSGLQNTTPGGSYNEPAAPAAPTYGPGLYGGGGKYQGGLDSGMGIGGGSPYANAAYQQGGGANQSMYANALMKKYGMEA